MSFRITISLAVLCLSALTWHSLTPGQIKNSESRNSRVQQIPYQKSADSLLDEDTQQLMAAKLTYSQKILEGLVTQDFEAVEKAAGLLSSISLNPAPDFSKAGDETDAQIYEHFRMEFARLAVQLKRHARRQELEASAYVQQNLTATCIACHDYIRDDLK